MQTYEDHRQTYARTFELAGRNQLLPELPGFALPSMETGPRSVGSSQLRPGYVPPVLLKAIAWIEASWAQADYSVPYGAAGPTLISHDCGYGLMQVTTGMQNVTGIPTVNQAMIGGHYAFNIARGSQIVVDKWNTAPEYRPIVGSRDPTILEDWYYAVWGYNGFSYKNHPLNPIYPVNRLPYSCGATTDGFGHNRGQYPYQELVFGCMAHPPIVSGVPLWTPQPVNVPLPGSPMFAGPLRNANWEACAYNLQCAAMDMATPASNHRDGSPLTVTRSQVIGAPSLRLSAGTLNMVSLPPSLAATVPLIVSNSGTGVLSYRVVSSASWLRTSRYQGVAMGSNLGGAPSILQVMANTSGLAPGRHTAQLTIDSPLTAGAPRAVTVIVDNYPNGTLLKGTGPQIYVMNGGLKRHVPNEFTFALRGYRLANVIAISDGVLNSLLPGNPLLNALADGNLYRGSGPAVWVMQAGVRRHVSSGDVFRACSYGWDAVRTISDSRLEGLAQGAALSSEPCPAIIPPESQLIKGTGPAVYLARSGLKRHVPNAETFDQLGLRWGNVDVLPDTQLSSIPLGHPMLDAFITGRLIKASDRPEVYVMQNGIKRHIATEATFNGCGYEWPAVVDVADARISTIPTGTQVTSSPCPMFLPPSGTMLQGSSPEVYVVQRGLKRHLPNVSTLEGRGHNWGNIDHITDTYLNFIPTGQPILDLLTDGSLLKGSGPEVYVMQGGAKRHIATGAVFATCGYRWTAINSLTDERLESIPTGAQLTIAPCSAFVPADGVLLQGDGLEVYAVHSGRRRYVVSEGVFNSCGYKWGNIDRVLNGVLASVPAGAPLTATPCP